MDDAIVYKEDDYIILKSDALLCSGFNVYRKSADEKFWEKQNDEYHFFIELLKRLKSFWIKSKMQDKKAQKMKPINYGFLWGQMKSQEIARGVRINFVLIRGLATIENDEVIATEFVCRKCALAYSTEAENCARENTNKDDYRS
jgi:hypothetical protein